MKAMDLRTALIEANNINLNGDDALVETSILKQLIESCKMRISQLDADAKTLAETTLTKQGAQKVSSSTRDTITRSIERMCTTSSTIRRNTTPPMRPPTAGRRVNRRHSKTNQRC